MSIYEDPRAIDQLADEAIEDMQERQALIDLLYSVINLQTSPQLRVILNGMMALITGKGLS